jgi:drug/metabolite transporter (DMT)-like permease
MGDIFVLISSICFALSNAYWKKVIDKVPFYIVIFYRGVITSLLFGIFLFINVKYNLFPILIQHDSVLTGCNFGTTIILCCFSGLGLYFFVKSMKNGKISLVVPLSSINVFSILTALFILHEQWKWIYGLEFILVIIGSLLLFYSGKNNNNSSSNKNPIFMSLLASFFWGISYALFKIPIKQIGILPFSFFLESSVTLFFLVIIKVRKDLLIINQLQRKQIKHYFILAILVVLGTLFVNLGLKNTSIFSFTILSNTGQIASILLGYFIYNERLKRNEIVGVSLLFISIVISILY